MWSVTSYSVRYMQAGTRADLPFGGGPPCFDRARKDRAIDTKTSRSVNNLVSFLSQVIHRFWGLRVAGVVSSLGTDGSRDGPESP